MGENTCLLPPQEVTPSGQDRAGLLSRLLWSSLQRIVDEGSLKTTCSSHMTGHELSDCFERNGCLGCTHTTALVGQGCSRTEGEEGVVVVVGTKTNAKKRSRLPEGACWNDTRAFRVMFHVSYLLSLNNHTKERGQNVICQAKYDSPL